VTAEVINMIVIPDKSFTDCDTLQYTLVFLVPQGVCCMEFDWVIGCGVRWVALWLQKFSLCDGLGWVKSVVCWVEEIGPTVNSGLPPYAKDSAVGIELIANNMSGCFFSETRCRARNIIR